MQSIDNKHLNGFNKFDFFLFITAAVLSFGGVGGSMTISRIITVAFAPLMFQRMKYCNFYAGTFVKWFAAFYFFCLISMLWTPDKAEGFKELIYYLVHFCTFFEVIVFARFARRPLKSLAWGWILMVLLCSVVAVWEISTGRHLVLTAEESNIINADNGILLSHFVSHATFFNYNDFVTILIFSFPWLLYAISWYKSFSGKWIVALSALVLGIIFITLNASRGGFASYALMLIMCFFMMPKSILKLVVLCLVIVVAGKFLWDYGEQIAQVLIFRLDAANGTEDPRIAIWLCALKTWVSYLGVGCGIGGMQVAMTEFANGGITITHNIALEILVQYGPVFCLAFIGFMLKQLRVSWRITDKKRRMALIMAIVTMPIYGIIQSGYLLCSDLFVLIATIYVFANIERIQSQRPIIQ